MMMGIALSASPPLPRTCGSSTAFPSPKARIKEHIKSLVEVYFCLHRVFRLWCSALPPEIALTPGLWAIPLVTGLILIIYHQRAVMAQYDEYKPPDDKTSDHCSRQVQADYRLPSIWP